MIPKIIHYVWVGNNPKSELAKQCIASWQKYLPDYEIIEWNNERFCSIAQVNTYARQAFDAGKWAFVSDYLRLYALYHYGGFYFDTDLEVTADLELFRQHQFVTGYESFKDRLAPITALMGSEPGNRVTELLLHSYNSRLFLTDNGKQDLTPNTGIISDIFAKHFGLTEPYPHDSVSKLTDNSYIYPSYYFCTPQAGKENFSIHHFNGSWFDEFSRRWVLKLGKYKLIRLRRNKRGDNVLPLKGKEAVVKHLGVNKRYSWLVVKEIAR